ncbi:hypothetical protein [Streptomyces sp. NPDC090057]|uniref:hypothetical protein n=1 Tax=Streptomyces sp. NPDC090057 TaxID=3365935 RepID=UPI0037F48D1E
MNDVPADLSRAEIAVADMPSMLLRMIPESADSIAETYGQPAETAVLTDRLWVRLYRLLAECFRHARADARAGESQP